MIIATVEGNLWSTKKDDRLGGVKFMVVKSEDYNVTFVAADRIGAGEGDRVLVSFGGSARIAEHENCPIDAAIIGIID